MKLSGNGACDEADKQGKYAPSERGRRALSWEQSGSTADVLSVLRIKKIIS